MKPFIAALLLVFVPAAMTAERLTLYTVNYPLQYFAQRIAGEHAEVVFPAPADVDPAFWTPQVDIVRDYQQADLILLNGAGYAQWLERVSLPQARMVDTSASFENGYIQLPDSVTHSHGPGGDHSHSGSAVTTWLDFYQAVQQAGAIMRALVQQRPGHEAEFERNFAALRKDLMALDLEMQKVVANKPGQPLLASHPVYQYLARRYQLHIQDLQWEPDVVPGAAEWQKLRYVTESFPALWMLWEKAPVPETVRQLESMDIDALVFDPCANRPAQGDFLAVMQDNVRNLGKAYQLPEQP